MSADAKLPVKAFDGVPFDDFYDRALPVVYGYLLRLCGGDRDEAWDLTQDSWTTVIDRLAQGQTDKATVGFVLSVARSHYLDSWRRQRRLQRKLRLVWSGTRQSESAELSASKVLDHLSVCSEEHRVVLMLAYVDDIPIAPISRREHRGWLPVISGTTRGRPSAGGSWRSPSAAGGGNGCGRCTPRPR
jgi:DNA-directed RNA polymerase specialized sigma24 family protein